MARRHPGEGHLPSKHPNIPGVGAIPNRPEGPSLDLEGKEFDFAQMKEVPKSKDFAALVNKIAKATGYPFSIIVGGIANTSGDTPMETVELWLQEKPISPNVIALLMRQATFFASKPEEFIELAKTNKWEK